MDTLDLKKLLRRFRFTWNNYSSENVNYLSSLTEKDCDYITFGFEIAPSTGTPHLQGYVEFNKAISGIACKKRLDPTSGKKSTVHLLGCNASREENIAYAQKTETKDSNQPQPFIELCFKDRNPGKRTDWVQIRELIKEKPSFYEVAEMYPEHAIRYPNGIKSLIAANEEKNQLDSFKSQFPDDARLYTWQRILKNRLYGKADDRKIIWFFDENGNQGKTWISKHIVANMEAARFTNASSKDIAHAYKGEKIVIMDFSRSNEERINYSILENLKDGMIFSPKYDSRSKYFSSPWVIVMANFMPNTSACSKDRWEIHTLSDDPILETVFDESKPILAQEEAKTTCNSEIDDFEDVVLIKENENNKKAEGNKGLAFFPTTQLYTLRCGGVRGEPHTGVYTIGSLEKMAPVLGDYITGGEDSGK